MTFSILARDASTGDLGVAVQSHWFSVGTVVSWAEAGVGAVATQSFVDAGYGPRLLDLLRRGIPAASALRALVAVDDEEERRQVAVVDTRGGVAVHTGSGCIAHAGHAVGEAVSCQANMMAGDTVPSSMLEAYEDAEGEPFAERLVTALEAGQGAGGDVRGQQSAALLVVAALGTGRPWIDRLVDLRVEDHREPIGELRRLVALHRGYEHMNTGDERLAVGDAEAASAEYEAARSAGITEASFWHAVLLAGEDDIDAACEILAEVFAESEGWRALLTRLPQADLLADEAVRAIERGVGERRPSTDGSAGTS